MNIDIDYINDIKWLILHLSYIIRKSKNINEDSLNEMISFSIDLLQLLELYKSDKFES